VGKQLSFVYDIADLYKADYIFPVAFRLAAENPPEIERAVRLECRRLFAQQKIIERIVPDIAKLLEISAEQLDAQGDPYAEDAAQPAPLWDPKTFSTELPIEQVLAMK
jgi:CRISPR-associated protein Cas1